MRAARFIRIRGTVQGVGFRPFVYRLAQQHNLAGWVLNGEEGVEIHAEGAQEGLLGFIDELRAKALRLGYAATELHAPERIHIEGTGSFLESPEFADVERMRTLFRALDEKSKLVALLDRVEQAGAMQIFIGNESEFSSAGDVTVVASPYGNEGRTLGTVGVIGPTRMNYSRVIPLVQFTAQTLRQVLEQG